MYVTKREMFFSTRCLSVTKEGGGKKGKKKGGGGEGKNGKREDFTFWSYRFLRWQRKEKEGGKKRGKGRERGKAETQKGKSTKGHKPMQVKFYFT